MRAPVLTATVLATMAGAAFTSACSNAEEMAAASELTKNLKLPDGFKATVFADDLGRARHLVVRENGDVYVNLRQGPENERVVALRDEDGDGKADRIERFGNENGTGIRLRGEYLYVSSDSAVYRYPLPAEAFVPAGPAEMIVGGFPDQRAHAAKTFDFDADGHIYVHVGVPSNACQTEIRTAGKPGRQPCDELERTGGIWRFDADKPGQDQVKDGHLFTTGIRHTVAVNFNDAVGQLYVVQHGRDQLNTLWPDLYTEEDNAELPAEEMHVLTDGSDLGWPYTYYDGLQKKRVISPEYGGDRKKTPEDGLYQDPIVAFPGHWAPNDLLFYTGDLFPESYKGGAFVAFHGSWNRAPLPQRGYNVVFVPFDGETVSGDWSVFADGFAGADPIRSPRNVAHRPTGLAEGPDGALYVADSVKGRIWRITYEAE